MLGVILKQLPFTKSDDSTEEEQSIPPPEEEVNLVNDDIEGKDAKSVEANLSSTSPVCVVGTASNLSMIKCQRYAIYIRALLVLDCFVVCQQQGSNMPIGYSRIGRM